MMSIKTIIDLAARPAYIQPLRDELEKAIGEDGWQYDESGERYVGRSTLAKMWKLDSFVKESMRLNPLSIGKSFISSGFALAIVSPCQPSRCWSTM